MESITYAGIGSRDTPPNVLEQMKAIAEELSKFRNVVLRTGGAVGADNAFLEGVFSGCGTYELYLPWPKYNGHTEATLKNPTDVAVHNVAQYVPHWDYCRESVRKLHGRNMHIILGDTLDTPVDFVICYTPNGKTVGGTAIAMNIATAYGIPIFNLFHGTSELEEYVNKLLGLMVIHVNDNI